MPKRTPSLRDIGGGEVFDSRMIAVFHPLFLISKSCHAHLVLGEINKLDVGHILAAINVFVMPRQELSRGSPITILRQPHVLSVKSVVFLPIVELFLNTGRGKDIQARRPATKPARYRF